MWTKYDMIQLQVTVKLTIQNRQAQVEVVPSAAALLIRALKEPPRDRKKVRDAYTELSLLVDPLLMNSIVNSILQLGYYSIVNLKSCIQTFQCKI